MAGKVNNRGMREVNRALVLDLIRRVERTSRSEIARETKLTKPTVGAIVEELIQGNVIREIGPDTRGTGVGRKARMLELNNTSAAYLSVQFGVGFIHLAVADALGEVLVVEREKHNLKTPEATLEALRPLARKALRAAKVPKSRVRSVGVVVPGIVDQQTGECVLAPNLGWENWPLRDEVAKLFGVPVTVHNITQAAALAESRVGVARGLSSFVWVYVGSGVGSVLVVKGQLFLGANGFAGEVGHCRVEENGVLCRCGNRGCVETKVAEPALVRAMDAEIARGEAEPPSAGQHDAASLVKLARGGDAAALRIFEQAGKFLGLGLSYLANICDVSNFVIGGRVAEVGTPLLVAAEQSLRDSALLPAEMRVVQSELGDTAGIKGAIFAALELYQRAPRVVGISPTA